MEDRPGSSEERKALGMRGYEQTVTHCHMIGENLLQGGYVLFTNNVLLPVAAGLLSC